MFYGLKKKLSGNFIYFGICDTARHAEVKLIQKLENLYVRRRINQRTFLKLINNMLVFNLQGKICKPCTACAFRIREVYNKYFGKKVIPRITYYDGDKFIKVFLTKKFVHEDTLHSKGDRLAFIMGSRHKNRSCLASIRGGHMAKKKRGSYGG